MFDFSFVYKLLEKVQNRKMNLCGSSLFFLFFLSSQDPSDLFYSVSPFDRAWAIGSEPQNETTLTVIVLHISSTSTMCIDENQS